MIPKRLITSALVTTLVACGGVSGGDGTSSTKLDSSLRSMRLGASSRADSAVALLVAIDSREVITVLNQSEEASAINQLLYRTTSGEVVSIAVEKDGIPVRATTSDASINFTRGSNNDLILQATVNGEAYPPISAAIPDQANDLLSISQVKISSSLTKEGTDTLKELLSRALIGVRVFGCSSQEAFAALQISATSTSIASNSCQSELLNTAQRAVEDNTIEDTEQDYLDPSSSCDQAVSGSLSQAASCLGTTGNQLVQNVLKDSPDLDAAVTGVTDPSQEIPNGGTPVDGNNNNGGQTTTTKATTTIPHTTTVPGSVTSLTTTVATSTTTTSILPTTISTTSTSTTSTTTVQNPNNPGNPGNTSSIDPNDPSLNPPTTIPGPPVK